MNITFATPLCARHHWLAVVTALTLALVAASGPMTIRTAAQTAPQAQPVATAPAQGAAPARSHSAAKKVLAIDDCTKWRSITGQELSGDGKWLVYALALTNTIQAESKPVLHLLNLESGTEVTVADATDAHFSPDSKWVAYQVDPGAAQRARASRSGAGAAPAADSAMPPAAPPATQAGQTGRGGNGTSPSGPRGADGVRVKASIQEAAT